MVAVGGGDSNCNYTRPAGGQTADRTGKWLKKKLPVIASYSINILSRNLLNCPPRMLLTIFGNCLISPRTFLIIVIINVLIKRDFCESLRVWFLKWRLTGIGISGYKLSYLSSPPVFSICLLGCIKFLRCKSSTTICPGSMLRSLKWILNIFTVSPQLRLIDIKLATFRVKTIFEIVFVFY